MPMDGTSVGQHVEQHVPLANPWQPQSTTRLMQILAVQHELLHGSNGIFAGDVYESLSVANPFTVPCLVN